MFCFKYYKDNVSFYKISEQTPLPHLRNALYHKYVFKQYVI
jgi:hypothetical protein